MMKNKDIGIKGKELHLNFELFSFVLFVPWPRRCWAWEGPWEGTRQGAPMIRQLDLGLLLVATPGRV